MKDKKQLYRNFIRTIGIAISGNNIEEFDYRYIHDPIFATRVKSLVASLMFSVDAYDKDITVEELQRKGEVEGLKPLNILKKLEYVERNNIMKKLRFKADDRGNVVDFYEQMKDGEWEKVARLDCEAGDDCNSLAWDDWSGGKDLEIWAISEGYPISKAEKLE